MKLAKNTKKWIFKQRRFCKMQYFIKYLYCLSFWKFLTFPFKKAEKFLQNSQKDKCVGISFLINFVSCRPATFLKRDSDIDVFLWIMRNFSEHPFCRTPPGDWLHVFLNPWFVWDYQLTTNQQEIWNAVSLLKVEACL